MGGDLWLLAGHPRLATGPAALNRTTAELSCSAPREPCPVCSVQAAQGGRVLMPTATPLWTCVALWAEPARQGGGFVWRCRRGREARTNTRWCDCRNMEVEEARGRCAFCDYFKTHKCFSTSTGLYKEDESATSTQNNVEKDSEKATEENSKQNLLKVISEMKVELSSKKKFQLLKALKTKDQPESMASASSMFQKATADSKAKRKLLNPELVEAASAVASSLPFDRKQTVSDLLALLRKHEEATDAQKRGEVTNISNIISNMKIGKRRLIRDVPGPSSQISFDDDEQDDRFQRGSLSGLARSQTRRGIHLKSRLNIFPDAPTATQRTPESESSPSLWDLELANEIAAVNHKPPRNGFEEMIQWTKEGKLWEFPINNEAGIEDDVEFHEHIFLDKYLEDFPKQGPIRHFMELVTCGLSKNPYLSVKEKAEHIEWFRNYFQEKEELLRELIDHKKETDLNLEMRNLSK